MVSNGTIRKSHGGFLWLSIVTIALSLMTIRPQFAIRCLCRLSTGVGHFGAKFAEEGADRCQPNLNVIWE